LTPWAFGALLRAALFSALYWLFGNLYEEIVMIPNVAVDPQRVLGGYHDFFLVIDPTWYFVPVTQLGVVAVWALYLAGRRGADASRLGKASLFGLLALLVTALIVTQINLKLFAGASGMEAEQLRWLGLAWLAGNMVRMALTAGMAWQLLEIYVRHRRAGPIDVAR
jgi:hypothetical protein